MIDDDLRRRFDATDAALRELAEIVNRIAMYGPGDGAAADSRALYERLASQVPRAAPVSQPDTTDVLGRDLRVGDEVLGRAHHASYPDGFFRFDPPEVVHIDSSYGPGVTYRVRLPRPEPTAVCAHARPSVTGPCPVCDVPPAPEEGPVKLARDDPARKHTIIDDPATTAPTADERRAAAAWWANARKPPPASSQAREIASAVIGGVVVGTIDDTSTHTCNEPSFLAAEINRAHAEALDAALAELRAERDRLQRGWDQATALGEKREVERNECYAELESTRSACDATIARAERVVEGMMALGHALGPYATVTGDELRKRIRALDAAAKGEGES